MKKAIFVFLVLTVVSGICFAADPVEGFWLSVDEKTGKVTAGWHVYQEGDKLFGKILSLADHPKTALADKCKDSYKGFPVAGKVNQMTVVGTPWLFGLTMSKTGEWKGGNIVDPDSGNMYGASVTFHAADGKKYQSDTLEMRGILAGPLGRSQFWQRTDQKTADSLGPK